MMEGCEAAVEWSMKEPEAERSSDIVAGEGYALESAARYRFAESTGMQN